MAWWARLTQVPGGRRSVAVVAGLAVVALTAAVFYTWGASGTPAAAPSTAPSPSSSATPPTVAEIYAALSPSVVSIEARTGESGSRGTGVIVNANAAILTALHVVNDAAEIRVLFADGTQSRAALVTADPLMDIAVLAPVTLPSLVVPAVLGGGPAVGDTVIAIGDQLGLASSATVGVVSGVGRAAPGEDGVTLSGLIQFDAAVNHGSSGGPLVNARGETIGIVVALANPTDAGTFIGIGFAVPIGAAIAAGDGEQIPQ